MKRIGEILQALSSLSMSCHNYSRRQGGASRFSGASTMFKPALATWKRSNVLSDYLGRVPTVNIRKGWSSSEKISKMVMVDATTPMRLSKILQHIKDKYERSP